jgi:uncharacterized membrane protein
MILTSVLLLCSVIFLVAGGGLRLLPPKTINSLYGYRTRASMASQERWDFAQKHGAEAMLYAALAMMALSWPSMRFLDGIGEDSVVRVVVELALLIAACVGMFVRTERALKDRFGPLPKKDWSKPSA